MMSFRLRSSPRPIQMQEQLLLPPSWDRMRDGTTLFWLPCGRNLGEVSCWALPFSPTPLSPEVTGSLDEAALTARGRGQDLQAELTPLIERVCRREVLPPNPAHRLHAEGALARTLGRDWAHQVLGMRGAVQRFVQKLPMTVPFHTWTARLAYQGRGWLLTSEEVEAQLYQSWSGLPVDPPSYTGPCRLFSGHAIYAVTAHLTSILKPVVEQELPAMSLLVKDYRAEEENNRWFLRLDLR